MEDQETYQQAIDSYNTIARIATTFLKIKPNQIFWITEKKRALSAAAYLQRKYIKRKTPNRYKGINVGFILLNKDKMTIKEMASELNCSAHKIRTTMAEFKIEYKPKIS